MQKVKLPLAVNATRAAQKRLEYVGVYSPAQVPRIADSVVSVEGDVNVSLSFNIDSQHLVVITGYADVMVTLMCQRCRGPFKHHVNTVYCFSPVLQDKPAGVLPEAYEPIDVNEFGEVDVLSMIEDEIILSLPLFPICQCEVSEANMVFGQLPNDGEKPNPFAVLASLKEKSFKE